jgi:hypothetical protein
MNNPFAKIKVSSAAEICAPFELKQEVQPLVRDGIAPREFVDALAVNRQYVAGIDFMAHGLPPREAIWWGCLCLQHASGGKLSELDKSACRAAIKWVLEPVEENRLAAKEPAEKAGLDCPAGALAAACHQTEDPGGELLAAPFAGLSSMAASGRSKAPETSNHPGRKPSFAPARLVTGAIKLASTKADPSRIVDTHRLFLELGIGVAEGRFGWPEIDRKAPPQKRRMMEDRKIWDSQPLA